MNDDFMCITKEERERFNMQIAKEQTCVSPEECLKFFMDREEFSFVKEIPKDKLWKLMFVASFVMSDFSD